MPSAQCLISRSLLSVLVALLAGAAPLSAQRTVVQDAGGGRKIELHYNAAGKVTETRTIGADGKLLEKNVLEYPPGALVAQSVLTSYWPNGQVRKITRDTYDNNYNFTGEFIQIFDENGKQVGGHKVTHDPQTNVYTCSKWNTEVQAYKVEDCPAGEESGTPEVVKKFTAEEVMQQLTRARAAEKQPIRRIAPPPAAPLGTAGTNVREVGVVLPAHIRPGTRISGSVVEDPGDYEGTPEVVVTRVALPFSATGRASSLAGWQLEISGEPPQSADAPIALTVSSAESEITLLFLQPDNAGAPVSKAIKLPAAARGKSKAPTSYLAPAICVKDQLCVVRGPFNGDATKTFAAFEQRPAKIVAETSDTAYVAIPDATEPGQRPLAIAEGAKAIAFPMVVAEYSIHPERRNVSKGETQLMYPRVEGPGDLPDAEWRPGNFPPSNLEQARKLLPGFKPVGEKREALEAGEKREAKEKQAAVKSGQSQSASGGESEENAGGEILLVVKNLTPDIVNFRDSKNGMYVFHLNAAAFKMGDFQYKFQVEAKQSGTFGVQGWLIPFLAPIEGQEFPMSPLPTK